jgi:hypothetical protein
MCGELYYLRRHGTVLRRNEQSEQRTKMLEWLGGLLELLWGAVALILSVDFLSDVLLLSVLYVVGRYAYIVFRTPPPPRLRSS